MTTTNMGKKLAMFAGLAAVAESMGPELEYSPTGSRRSPIKYPIGSRAMYNRIVKRRKRNKIARKSRQINRRK